MARAPQNPTRRQHFVTRAYLANFASPKAGENGRLWVYEKNGGGPRLQSLKDTAVEKNIYTVSHSDAESPDIIERKVFGPIENVAIPVLRRLANGDSALSESERAALSLFLATLHLRVPRNLEATRELSEVVAIETLKLASNDPSHVKRSLERAKQDGINWTEEQIKDFLSNPEKHVKIRAKRELALGLNLKSVEAVASMLMLKRWSVCHAPEGAFFITGDSPLIVFVRMGGKNVIFGGGFAQPGAQIHFPLSPSTCLFLSQTNAPATLKLDRPSTEEVNRRCAFIAQRFIYAPYLSNRVRKLVAEFANSGKGPKVNRAKVAERIAAMERPRPKPS